MLKNKFIKTTLLNVDSSYRNIIPKNIVKSDCKLLPNNPIKFRKGDSIVSFNYPNHSLKIGDYITIQNVIGKSFSLINSFILINNVKYLIIYSNDNQLNNTPIDYLKYTDELYINIEVVGTQTENKLIKNINYNNLFGIKKYFIYSDIPQVTQDYIKNTLFDINFNIQNALFVELPFKYRNNDANYYIINQIFKISFMHIGGIKLGFLNANFPINNYNYQSNYQVSNVYDDDNFAITLNFNSYADLQEGGKNVQVMKIIDTIAGYPNSDSYTLNLKNSFNNVTNIELVSTEMPYIDLTIKKDINDKLYWFNVEDGDYLYSVQLDEGYYSSNSLLDKLKEKINKIKRISSTDTNLIYNNFEILVESNIQKITFLPFNLTKLPNKLSARLEVINFDTYIILNVNHENYLVEKDDIIEIKNSTQVTYIKNTSEGVQIFEIPNDYINKIHTIFNVNSDNTTYDILIGKVDEISTKLITDNKEKSGGENVLIKSKTQVSFLFNKKDTIGEIIGFKNVGDSFSITPFSSVITNKDDYVYSNNLNSVGLKIDYSSGFFNLSGKFNYLLMYLNDIEFVYSNNNVPAAFAKIALSGSPGDILFDTFISQPQNIYSKIFPISSLTQIIVKFLYPDGSRVNFRNINHSFTLKITEEQERSENTNLNSQLINVSDEFKKASLNH
jgi:hypothetical protein